MRFNSAVADIEVLRGGRSAITKTKIRPVHHHVKVIHCATKKAHKRAVDLIQKMKECFLNFLQKVFAIINNLTSMLGGIMFPLIDFNYVLNMINTLLTCVTDLFTVNLGIVTLHGQVFTDTQDVVRMQTNLNGPVWGSFSGSITKRNETQKQIMTDRSDKIKKIIKENAKNFVEAQPIYQVTKLMIGQIKEKISEMRAKQSKMEHLGHRALQIMDLIGSIVAILKNMICTLWELILAFLLILMAIDTTIGIGHTYCAECVGWIQQLSKMISDFKDFVDTLLNWFAALLGELEGTSHEMVLHSLDLLDQRWGEMVHGPAENSTAEQFYAQYGVPLPSA